MAEACYKVLGRNVKRERNKAGMTQQELADAIGMTRTNLANVESGRVRTPIHRLLNIIEVLDTTFGEITEGFHHAPLPTGEDAAEAVMALQSRRKSDISERRGA